MLGGEGAVGGDPLRGVVRSALGVAGAGGTGGEYAVVVRFEGQVHELVHVAADEHVGVEEDDAVVLGEGEYDELCPGVVETRVAGVVALAGGDEARDGVGGDSAGVEGVEGGGGEGVDGEGDEGVGGVRAPERVVEGEEAREILGVGDEGGPDWGR